MSDLRRLIKGIRRCHSPTDTVKRSRKSQMIDGILSKSVRTVLVETSLKAFDFKLVSSGRGVRAGWNGKYYFALRSAEI